MKQEIRERLESIQKGEAPEGYNETKVGIIPVEWKITTFEDIAEKKVKWSITGGPFGSNLKASEYTSDGIRIIQLQNIGDGVFNDDYKIYTSEEKANELLSCNIFPNEIILSKMGDPVARACFVPNTGMRFLMSSDGIRLVVDESRFSKKFIHDYINSIYFRKRAFDASIGSTRLRIGLQDLKKLLVIAPPLLEQQKIADILSTWNNAIELIEKLIEEKKEFKRGLIQKLLSGEMRFPEFNGKWKKVVIGEIPEGYKKTKVGIIPEEWDFYPLVNISSMNGRIGWQGLKQSEFTMNPYDPFLITGMNFKDGKIRWEEVYHVPHSRYDEAIKIQLKIDDVLMTKDGTIGKLLYIDQIPYPGKASLNSHLLVFRPLHNRYIPKFLLYQLDSNIFKNHIELEKSGTTFFGITQEGVGKYKILLPPLSEQQKITEILSTWEKAIELKEKELNQLKEQKKSLMQLLLTGIVRVEVD